MPYTPASPSPASSATNSPAISRSSSYSEDGPRSPVTGRPQPPRSNSASYLHKHRRSPSLPKSDTAAPPTPTETPDSTVEATDFAHNSSVRQSPPPVSNHLIPTGMVLSPPDSSENSDGDERKGKDRGRGLRLDWDQLKEAVQWISLKREGSPDRAGTHLTVTTSEPVTQTVSPSALTAEARKISHSRSSTETAIIIPRAPTFASPIQTSDDSDDDQDQGPFSKPSLVRKKSGELVKPALRPSSRRRYSSMPGTPTYSKSVHFNDTENQTRHFLQVDKPIAVSAGSSPIETYDSEAEFPFDEQDKAEREIRLANFPVDTFERKTKPIRVERIFLSADKQTLIGTCAAQNISFHKLVIARFTLDYWKTTSEVVAEYNNDPRNPTTDGCDRFNFHIKLSDQANIDNKTLLLCVRYNVNGTDHWDNNNDINYQIDFVKSVRKVSKPSVKVGGLGARPLSAIPRSRHTSPVQTRGRQESMDDEFTRVDTSSAYHFGGTDKILAQSPTTIKLKPRSKQGSVFPGSSALPGNNVLQSPTNGLGGRYDFGASLSVALSTAQDKLGRQSGLMNGTQKPSGGSYFGPHERKDGPARTSERPDSATTAERPAMGSDQYRDLVQKFCYFTPGVGKPTGSSPPPNSNNQSNSTAPRTDGADENTASPSSSGTNSPSPAEAQAFDGNNDSSTSTALGPFVSRSASPAVATGGGLGARSASPISFGYPFHSNARDGYLSDAAAPTAILG
ncbi:hypothetical protein LTR08_006643 [Meristemomyces frigidus]|nr:hypothetical protein LTR08_006643 [Meristemomyces frigidus]